MATELDGIQKSLAKISKGEDLMSMLLEFERTLDNTEIYAYKNWALGELVDGPHVSRYWFKSAWMFPEKKMPDPRGGLRLEKIGCNIKFRKDVFKKPLRVIKTPDDLADVTTKKAKMADLPVWIVEIEMPMKYIEANEDLINDYIGDEIDSETEALPNQYETAKEDDFAEDDFAEDDFGEEEF